MSASRKRRIIAYEICDQTTSKVVERIDVQDKGERHAEKVFDGLCHKVDFERFFVRPVKGSGERKK